MRLTPLVVVLISLSSPAYAAPIRYELGAFIVADATSTIPDCCSEWMSGFLTFSSTLHDEDADPLHGRYTDPNATIQMMFSGILSSLSGTLIGPMTIDIFLQPTLPPFRALWNVSVVGADGRSASFGLGNYGLDDWQDDTAANLLRLGEGATSDFFLTGPGYSVYGPSSARRLQSVPEPSTLLLSMGGVIAAVWLRRRR